MGRRRWISIMTLRPEMTRRWMRNLSTCKMLTVRSIRVKMWRPATLLVKAVILQRWRKLRKAHRMTHLNKTNPTPPISHRRNPKMALTETAKLNRKRKSLIKIKQRNPLNVKIVRPAIRFGNSVICSNNGDEICKIFKMLLTRLNLRRKLSVKKIRNTRTLEKSNNSTRKVSVLLLLIKYNLSICRWLSMKTSRTLHQNPLPKTILPPTHLNLKVCKSMEPCLQVHSSQQSSIAQQIQIEWTSINSKLPLSKNLLSPHPSTPKLATPSTS